MNRKVWGGPLQAMSLMILLAIVIVSGGCKKKDEVQKPVAPVHIDYGQGTGFCRLISANKYDGGGGMFKYDNLGRLASVSGGGASRVFSYDSNRIIVTVRNTPSIISGYDTVMLDSKGRIISSNFLSSRYFYNDQGELTHITWSDGQGTTGYNYFTWKDGDLVQDSSQSRVRRYAYYTNLPVQYASFHILGYWNTYGVPLYKPKHLLKTITDNGGNPIHFTYNIDDEGKIMSDTARAATFTSFSTYSYECN
jgi:hypothetical protein